MGSVSGEECGVWREVYGVWSEEYEVGIGR